MALCAAGKGLQFCRQEIGRRDNPNAQACLQLRLVCRIHGGPIPPIRKAEDPFFDGHYIQFHFVDQPAAEGRASAGIFPKPEGAPAFREVTHSPCRVISPLTSTPNFRSPPPPAPPSLTHSLSRPPPTPP